jgi:hypothetical protein
LSSEAPEVDVALGLPLGLADGLSLGHSVIVGSPDPGMTFKPDMMGVGMPGIGIRVGDPLAAEQPASATATSRPIRLTKTARGSCQCAGNDGPMRSPTTQ